jgi:hypothetical protein
MNIKSISRFGRSFSIVRVPYSFKLLMQELEAMNIQMRIITDENVDQLLGMSYSDNIQKLLKSDNSNLQEVIQIYTSEINNILKTGSETTFQKMTETPEIPEPIESNTVEAGLSLLQPESDSGLYPSYPDLSPAYVPQTPTSSQVGSVSPAYAPGSPAYEPGSPAYVPKSQNTSPLNNQGTIPVTNLQLQQPLQNLQQTLQNLQQTPNVVLTPSLVSGIRTSPIIIQQPFVTTVPLPLQTSSSSPQLESILNVEEAKTENKPEENPETASENSEKKVAFNIASTPGESSSSSSSNSETKKITL